MNDRKILQGWKSLRGRLLALEDALDRFGNRMLGVTTCVIMRLLGFRIPLPLEPGELSRIRYGAAGSVVLRDDLTVVISDGESTDMLPALCCSAKLLEALKADMDLRKMLGCGEPPAPEGLYGNGHPRAKILDES